MEQQQAGRVLACLEVLASPSADPGSVKAAESALASESAQAGYGVVLCRLALGSAGLHPGLRQAAAVLLKRYVKSHWVEGERGFEPPQASDADKAAIRAALPAGLGDTDARVRGAVGGAIAAVAGWDWPGAWPGLLESLVGSIKAASDPHLLMGCLQCLSVMASDLDHESAPRLLQALSPELCALAASPGTPKGLAATCFSIMADLTSSLAALSGSYQRQVREMLGPLLPPWVQLVCSALGTDMKLRADWPVKLAALRLSQPLVTYFSKPLEACMPPLMGATWQLLLAAEPVHQALLVEGADEDDVTDASGVDEDEEPVQLETLLSQLFELLLSFVGPARFARQLEAALPQMVFVSIAYLQMTQEQMEAWSVSANQFVADEEEDIISCRASAELLLAELSEAFPSALPALLEAVGRRLPEADAAASAGRQAWWQMREAALQAVAACSEQLVQAVQEGALPAQQLQQLLDTLLQRDLQPLLPGQQQQQQPLQLGDGGRQFLLGRALRVCAKLQEVASPAQRQSLLQAAAAAVTADASPAVHVSAYKALAAVCPVAPAAQLAPLCGALLGALVARLAGAEEEVLHLVLEVLEVVIAAAAKAGTAAPGSAALVSAEQAMAVAQPVLQAWAAHTADPLISPDAQAVIAAIAELPGCLPSLAAAAAPTLAGFVSRGAAARKAARQGGAAAAAAAASAPGGAQESPMLVEASLDLLGTLVAPGQPAVAVELARGILGPLLDLIASSDDPSELQSAVALLLQLLRVCPPPELAVAVGSGSPEQLLCRLLAAARALLAPAQPDSCVGVAGPLLAQLLKAFPSALAAPAPAELLAAGDAGAAGTGAAHPPSCLGLLLGDVVRKMGAGGCSPATLAGLLEFLVRLALLDAQQLLEQLAGMQVAQPGGATTSGLAVVVPLWLEHATDMPSSLLTRQMAAALLQLLQLRNHAALASLTVPGRPLEAAGAAGGRVTRSRARQQGGLQYTQVPAAVKTLQVLGQLLAADAEASAGGFRGLAAGAGDEGEWDDEYESDDDEDGNAAGAAGMRLTGSALRGLPAELLHDDVINRSAGATPVPDDPADADEPLMRLSLASLLRQGLGALAASDPGFLQAAAAQLGSGSAEVVALQQLLAGER